MKEVLNKTLHLVFSSKRPMPAHFTSNGERNQSFCIDFEPLTADDDEAMAADAWGYSGDFLPSDITKVDFDLAVKCGEDVMLGAYIITKLGHREMIDDMRKAVIDDTIETFGKEFTNIRTLLADAAVNKYFDHCVEYGKNRALNLI